MNALSSPLQLPDRADTPLRHAVYTCVLGRYDAVYPPILSTPGVDHLLFTDQTGGLPRGWRSVQPSQDGALSAQMANRHCKFFPELYLPDYDASLYIDGNIRLRGDLRPLFDLLDQGFDMVLLRHSKRQSVEEEVHACARRGKADPEVLRAELAALQSNGFVDSGILSENNVVLRRHGVSAVESAMQEWWAHTLAHSGRDQISLPFFLQKHAVRVLVLPFNARGPNPFFYDYPHLAAREGWRWRVFVDLSARRGEGFPMGQALKLWKRLFGFNKRSLAAP